MGDVPKPPVPDLIIEIFAGEWPEGSETQMLELADVWKAAAEDFKNAREAAEEQRDKLLAAIDGESADAMRDSLKKLIDDAEGLETLEDGARQIEDYCRQFAWDLQTTKNFLNLAMLEAAASLAMLAIPVFGAGASAAKFAAKKFAIRAFLRGMMEKIGLRGASTAIRAARPNLPQIGKSIVRNAVEESATQSGMELAAQAQTNASGNDRGYSGDRVASTASNAGLQGGASTAVRHGINRRSLGGEGLSQAGGATLAGIATGDVDGQDVLFSGIEGAAGGNVNHGGPSHSPGAIGPSSPPSGPDLGPQVTPASPSAVSGTDGAGPGPSTTVSPTAPTSAPDAAGPGSPGPGGPGPTQVDPTTTSPTSPMSESADGTPGELGAPGEAAASADSATTGAHGSDTPHGVGAGDASSATESSATQSLATAPGEASTNSATDPSTPVAEGDSSTHVEHPSPGEGNASADGGTATGHDAAGAEGSGAADSIGHSSGGNSVSSSASSASHIDAPTHSDAESPRSQESEGGHVTQSADSTSGMGSTSTADSSASTEGSAEGTSNADPGHHSTPDRGHDGPDSTSLNLDFDVNQAGEPSAGAGTAAGTPLGVAPVAPAAAASPGPLGGHSTGPQTPNTPPSQAGRPDDTAGRDPGPESNPANVASSKAADSAPTSDRQQSTSADDGRGSEYRGGPRQPESGIGMAPESGASAQVTDLAVDAGLHHDSAQPTSGYDSAPAHAADAESAAHGNEYSADAARVAREIGDLVGVHATPSPNSRPVGCASDSVSLIKRLYSAVRDLVSPAATTSLDSASVPAGEAHRAINGSPELTVADSALLDDVHPAFDRIEQRLHELGAGSSALVTVSATDGPTSTGHALVAVNDSGTVRYFDPIGHPDPASDKFYVENIVPSIDGVDSVASSFIDPHGMPVQGLDSVAHGTVATTFDAVSAAIGDVDGNGTRIAWSPWKSVESAGDLPSRVQFDHPDGAHRSTLRYRDGVLPDKTEVRMYEQESVYSEANSPDPIPKRLNPAPGEDVKKTSFAIVSDPTSDSGPLNLATFTSHGHVTTSVEASIETSFNGLDRSGDEYQAQKLATALGSDARSSDHAGHILGHRFFPDLGKVNLFAQDAKFNTGQYRVMENEIADWTRYDNTVSITVDFARDQDSLRPTEVNPVFDVADSDENPIHDGWARFVNEAVQPDPFARTPHSRIRHLSLNS